MVRLYAWSGWRPALTVHSLRALRNLTLGGYPGLVLLGYVEFLEGFSIHVWYGACAGLLGIGLGALWGLKGNARVVQSLERGEAATRTWRDPSPAFGIVGGAVVVSLLAWLVAAYFYRPFESTWSLFLPAALLFSGATFSFNDVITGLSIRAVQKRTGGTIQVSLGEHGGDVYRVNPRAHRVRRL